jgi:hypothetical protein
LRYSNESDTSHNAVITEIDISSYICSNGGEVRFIFDEDRVSLYQERLSFWKEQIWVPLSQFFADCPDSADFANDVHRLVIHLASLDSFKVKSNRQGKRWWNSRLTDLFKQKRQLYNDHVFLRNNGFSGGYTFQQYQNVRKEYAREIRLAKREVGVERRVQMEAVRGSNPRQFWKELRCLRSSRNKRVPELMYSSAGVLSSDKDIWADAWSKVGEHDIFDPSFDSQRALEFALQLPDLLSSDDCDENCSEILNTPISFDEVVSVICHMSLKAGGLDGICSEQLKFGGHAIYMMAFEMIRLMWNKLAIPEIWKQGVIFPLYKKGDIHQADNYRGITLQCLSCKILDKVLTNRMKKWMSVTGLVHSNQGGYQAGRWTQDWLFVLREVMFSHKRSKVPLYICFFDVRKAFDRVWHDGLFTILHQYGVRGQFLRMLYTLYKESYSTVLVNGAITKFFQLYCGVKQGGCSSPDLYIIFVNQLAEKLEALGLGYSLAGIWLGLFLFCDDMVILSESRSQLQKMIDVISIHCEEWRYSLAVEKTKVMTVGCTFGQSKFMLQGVLLEEVEEYKYLGGVLNRNLKDSVHFKQLLEKLKSSAQATLCLGLRSFSIKTCQVLFDSLVASAGTYGSQTFIPRSSMVQRFDSTMRGFYKRAFGASVSTHNCVFFGELQALSFEERFAKEALGYLWRLFNSPTNSLVSKVFNVFLQSTREVEVGSRKLMSSLEYMLTLVRKYDISLDPKETSKSMWAVHVTKQLAEHSMRKWESLRSSSTVLSYGYNMVKCSPQLEWYAKHRDSYVSRLIFKLRSGSCALAVSTGRYSGIAHEDRICPMCNEDVEDVLHFCSKCSALEDERKEWKDSVYLICDEVGIPDEHLSCAKAAMADLGDLDVMRLMLCSSSSLSFSTWMGFENLWWPFLETSIFEASFKAIYRMYTKRILLVHGSEQNVD